MSPEAEKFLSQWGVIHRALAMGASDIVFSAGTPVCARVHGQMTRLEAQPLSLEQMHHLGNFFTDESLRAQLVKTDADYTLEFPGLQRRFRVNAFQQHRGPAFVLRVLQQHVPTLDQLGIPASFGKVLQEKSGLVLVTGTTGSGKSTTLTALLEAFNSTQQMHIITIEDPIEFVYTERRSVIEQRELGVHVDSFARAVKSALRQAPDIILVGEIRDEETAQMVLKAAQIGILVFSTLHTRSAGESISRFIGMFDDNWRASVRLQLADCTKAILCQKLMPRADGQGRIAACEIMWCTTAIRHLIRDDKLHLLHSLMEVSSKDGMVTMEGHLLERLRGGAITLQTAFENVNDKLAFISHLPPEQQQQLLSEWETDVELKRLEQMKETQRRQMMTRTV